VKNFDETRSITLSFLMLHLLWLLFGSLAVLPGLLHELTGTPDDLECPLHLIHSGLCLVLQRGIEQLELSFLLQWLLGTAVVVWFCSHHPYIIKILA